MNKQFHTKSFGNLKHSFIGKTVEADIKTENEFLKQTLMKITLEKEFYKHLAETTAWEKFDEIYKSLPAKYLEPSFNNYS